MQAVLYDRFGPPEVLRLGELPAPTLRRGEVLVRVHAAALNPKDVLVRKGKFRLLAGRRFPRVPGYDLAGEVVTSHHTVSDLTAGARVHGMVNAWRGGTCAELCAVPANELAPWPPGLSAPEAAALPLAALTALQALRDQLRLRGGERLLINGASGGVGTVAVQIARILGARVTAVCSARNAALVQELGADAVLDYTQTDPLAGATWDAIFDVFGNLDIRRVRPALRRGGAYVTTIPSSRTVLDVARSRLRGPAIRLVVVRSNRADLVQLGAWVADGRLRPVLDRVLPLAESRAAHAVLETKRARGKVVLTLDAAAS